MSTVTHLKIVRAIQEYIKYSNSYERSTSVQAGVKARALLSDIKKLCEERRKEIKETVITDYQKTHGEGALPQSFRPNTAFLSKRVAEQKEEREKKMEKIVEEYLKEKTEKKGDPPGDK